MSSVAGLPNPAEQSYIEHARQVIPSRFASPDAPLDFDAPVWDFTAYATHLARGKSATVTWVITDGDGATGIPCDPRFLQVLKAYCIHSRYTKSATAGLLFHARYLWRAIAQRLGGSGDAFSWRQVGEADLDRMLELMRPAIARSSQYAAESAINRWMGKLHEAKVTVVPRRKTRTSPPDAPGTIQEDGSSKLNTKLPSREAIEALAEIRRREDLSAYDRLLAELSLLCICLGLRGGEALTLLDDCLQEGPDGQSRVAFFREKGRAGVSVDDSAPVYDVLKQDVHEAVSSIRKLTDHARSIAASIEQGGVRLPGFPDDEGRITSRQVANLTGYDPSNIVNWKLKSKVQVSLGRPKKASVNGTRGGVRADYRVGEVRQKLAQMFSDRARWHVVAEDGTVHPLSRALCCIPYNLGDSRKSVNRLLAEPLRLHDWDRWLGGERSVFKRLRTTPAQQAVSMNTHGFRHLHTQLLQRGNVSSEDIMRVMRRGNPQASRQLRAYNGLSQEERVAQLVNDIKGGTVIGGVADTRRIRAQKEVAFEEAEIFPATRVVAVHVTPYGACTHSFGTSPCPKHTGCLDDCGDYCVRTDDERAKVNLVQLVHRTKHGLENARVAAARGTAQFAQEWLDRQERTVARVESILTQIEAAPRGVQIRPFEGMPSKATPFAPPREGWTP